MHVLDRLQKIKRYFDIIVVSTQEYQTYRENEKVGMYGIIQSRENETVNGMWNIYFPL